MEEDVHCDLELPFKSHKYISCFTIEKFNWGRTACPNIRTLCLITPPPLAYSISLAHGTL